MDTSEIEKKVAALTAELLSIDPSKPIMTARFVDDLGADSLDTVDLLKSIEEEFNIEITDEHCEGINTVGDAVNYIHTTLS